MKLTYREGGDCGLQINGDLICPINRIGDHAIFLRPDERKFLAIAISKLSIYESLDLEPEEVNKLILAKEKMLAAKEVKLANMKTCLTYLFCGIALGFNIATALDIIIKLCAR